MQEFVLAAIIWLASGFLQGVTGFGSALLAVPLLTLFLPVRVTVSLCVLCGVGISMFMAFRLRQDFRFGRVTPMFIGVLPGIVAGTTLLARAPEHLVLGGIGVLLVGYSAWGLFVRPVTLFRGGLWSRVFGAVAGFLTGAIGTAFATGGPPVIIYSSLTDWSKDEIKAGLSGLFVVTIPLMALAHILGGITGGRSLLLALVCVPASILGARLGLAASRHIGDVAYRRALFITLIVMGVMMLARL